MPDEERLREWIGREEVVEDVLALGPARGLAALLDRDAGWIRPGAPLPPLWHWAYLLAPAPASRLGADGHARTGDFLPPSPLPRRVWAGGHLRFHHPLQLGATARRVSTVAGVEEKQSGRGPFVLVTVNHRILAGGGVAVEEDQALAYREPLPPSGSPEAAADLRLPAAAWSEVVRPGSVMLFRFSALTLNGYRIHYDQAYARDEGYPDLVVHAPLLALLLHDGAQRRLSLTPTAFEYRARTPLFAGEAIRVEGASEHAGALVWARGEDGRVAMTGRVS